MAETPFQLELERMMDNPNYRVVVAGLGGANKGQVVGFLQDDLKFGGGNNYNNPFESEAQQKLSDIATKAQPVIAKIGQSFGANISTSQFSLKSFEQTIESWTGSQKPSFSMRLTFIALGPDDDVTAPIKQIMRAVMPTRGDLAGIGTIIRAPLGYGPELVTKNGRLPSLQAKGTLAIQVGKWFRAMGQICRKAQPMISKQVIASGRPLYSTVDFDFEPYRAISYQEFLGYFTK